MSADADQPHDIRVYVNDRGVSVPHGSTALDAVKALFPDAADEIAKGTSRLSDSRGLPVAADIRVNSGAIFRVHPVRDHAAEDSE